jgi:hypothetical protein
VVDIVNPVSFWLELPLQWKQKKIHPVFHTSLLSPYKEMEEHGENFPEPPPNLIEGEEEYEVEQVLNSRWHGCGKKLQYLLRWRGYSQAHDSWESVEQVHAPELVDRFHQENPEAIRAICLKEDELDDEKAMSHFHPTSATDRTSPTTCWTSPVWDPSPAPPTWGLLTPLTPTVSWNITPTFQYEMLFGNLVTTQNQTLKEFEWESEERRQAADNMFCFLKVIEQAQDFEGKIHHMFKSGRKALLCQCEENCENCRKPATCRYWGS